MFTLVMTAPRGAPCGQSPAGRAAAADRARASPSPPCQVGCRTPARGTSSPRSARASTPRPA
eukprot:5270316-Pyramimonas_sp.AAC.1